MWGTPIPAADHAKDYLTLRDLVTQEKTLGKMLIGPDVAYRLDYFTEYVTMLLYYKWKNHFYEMKGDVGMSLHEKERNKKMPTPRHKVTHNPIPTSLCCFNMLFVCLFVMNALGKANSTTS